MNILGSFYIIFCVLKCYLRKILKFTWELKFQNYKQASRIIKYITKKKIK